MNFFSMKYGLMIKFFVFKSWFFNVVNVNYFVLNNLKNF